LLDTIDLTNRVWFKDVVNRTINGERLTIEKIFEFGGKLLDMELSLNPISGKSGDDEGISFLARNITQRNLLEEKLESAHKHLYTSRHMTSKGLFHLS